MAISYPTSLDNFANPTGTDLVENASSTLDHDVQHSNANDAIEALQAKVGANSSAVTTSHDYKLSGVTGTDKAVSKTGTETLTNKTLTSPVINVTSDATGDMYYRNSGGAFTRLPVGPSGTIISSNGTTPEWIANPGASDSSTTVKGVVELATYAETIARTTTGGTGAKLVPTADNLPSVMIYDYQADAVGTDFYAITCSPAPTAYSTGMRFTFKAGTANTGAASLNVNGLGAKTIKKNYNSDLETGDILADQIIEVVYDGTNMQMVTPVSSGNPYTINADERISSFFTKEVPMVVTSSSTMTGWTVVMTGGGANLSQDGAGSWVNITATADSLAFTNILPPGGASTNNYTYGASKTIRYKQYLKLADTTNRKGWGFAITAANIYTAQSDTTNGEIRFINNAGTLYAQNANGTATSTDITSGITMTNWNLYEIVFTPGVDIKYYINGTLKATHTTNLPTTGTPVIAMGTNAGGAGIVTMPPIVSVQL